MTDRFVLFSVLVLRPSPISTIHVAVSSSSVQFGLDLYREMAVGRRNTFFSPVSLQSALSMLYAGSRGETAKQMGQLLHDPNFDIHEVFHYWLTILRLEGTTENRTTLLRSNIFVQKGGRLNLDFLRILATSYDAQPTSVNFFQPEKTRLDINDWFARNTFNRIENLLKPGVIQPHTRLVLANALYFKAPWMYTFPVTETKLRQFYTSPSQAVTVPTMHVNATLKVARIDQATVIELPYDDGAFSMLIILPDTVGSLRRVEGKMKVDVLTNVLKRLRLRDVSLYLPRFKLDQSLELKPLLIRLGMKDAFKPGRADFSPINGRRNLVVQNVYHAANLDVNEQGTEAAATTAVLAMLRSSPMSRTVVRVNRPFMFLVRDNEFGMPLFMGRVWKPIGEK